MKSTIIKIFIFSACVGVNAYAQDSSEKMGVKLHSDATPKSASARDTKQLVFDHSVWTSLLSEHVKSAGKTTQVDYAAIAKKESVLQKYLDSLSSVKESEFDRWGKQDQLAFLLNVYNAWTVKLILSDFENIDSIKDLGSFLSSPWKKKWLPLFGEDVSLDYVEHTLIRGSGRYNDPRIHFAANCASIGCPSLRQEAYEGSRLDMQLEEQTKLFLSDSSRNYADGKKLQISSIFKWYKSDFEAGWRDAHTLQEFLFIYKDALSLTPDQASALELDEMKVSYLDYDWNLNKTP